MTAERLCVALDVPDVVQAARLVERLDGIVSFFKVGLWLAFAPGIDGLLADLARSGKQVFLDAKMYDIGQTVEQGVGRAAERGVAFVTIHGDEAIVRAAVRGRAGSNLKLLAVSVLTSLDDAALAAMGYRLSARELIDLRVRQAAACGCDGVIASPQDDPDALRAGAGASGLLVVTPGVRREGDARDDHRRQATPRAAMAAGADYLVVGRPIISAPDPAVAAGDFIAQMRLGLADRQQADRQQADRQQADGQRHQSR